MRGRLGQRVLDHVGGVDAGRQPGVEPDRHHAAEPVPVPPEELIGGGAVPGGGAVEQVVRIRRRHRGPPTT